MVVNKIDEYFLRAKTAIPYPCILIESKQVEALPVLMESLEEGTVSVIFEYDGKFNVPKKKISNSALTLEKVLRVYPFTLILSESQRVPIRVARDLLNVGVWT